MERHPVPLLCAMMDDLEIVKRVAEYTRDQILPFGRDDAMKALARRLLRLEKATLDAVAGLEEKIDGNTDTARETPETGRA